MESELKQKIISWVQESFKSEKFNSIDFEFPECDTTGGYAAEMVYVNVKAQKGKDTKKYNIIVKKNRDSEAMMDSLNFREIYRREVHFYSTYLPYLHKFAEKRGSAPFDDIPHCYGTVNEKNHYVIIMENLKPKNYQCHPLGGDSMTLDQVKLVVTAYAKWHGFGLAVREQDPAILKEFDRPSILLENENLMKNINSTIENELEYAAGLYKAKNDLKLVEILQRLKRDYEKMLREMLENEGEEHLVVRHGDSWNNNYLFHYNEEDNHPDKVVIIDWQAGLLGSPLADLTQFLFNCCSRKELDHLDDILKLYHETLSDKLKELGCDPKKVFPWEVCKKSFERYAPVGIAGVPICARMCFKAKVDQSYDFADSIEDGNIDGLLGNKLTDPVKYFERIDGILKLVVERKLV